MIGVVDYKAGNLKSVETALKKVRAKFFISDDPKLLLQSDKMIFPGVGEAGTAMSVLKKSGLDICIKDFAASGKPLLGICLGSQIIFDHSEESDTECLGLVSGNIKRFQQSPGEKLKIPQIGWNPIQMSDPILFNGIPEGTSFYFVHSYYICPEDSATTIASAEYGIEFTAAVRKGNVWGTQFHPEKSGRYGLKILENFAGYKG